MKEVVYLMGATVADSSTTEEGGGTRLNTVRSGREECR